MQQILFIFISLLFSLSVLGQDAKKLKKVVDKIIVYDTEINFEQTPGYIIGIIDRDSTFVLSYGRARKGNAKRIYPNTIFEMGSLSKVFTVSIAAMMEADSLLDLDRSINIYLDDDFQNKELSGMTVRELINHTSGLPRLPPEFGIVQKDANNPYAHYTKEHVLECYKNFKKKNLVEGNYHYSHLNYALLEIILEKTSGEPFYALLDKYITKPLGMTSTYIGENEKLEANMAAGYSLSGIETSFKKYASHEAALGIRSSLADMLKFVEWYLGMNLDYSNRQVLGLLEDNGETGFSTSINYASGWHLIKQRRYYDIVVHPGRTNGHQITLHFVPETKTAAIVMANSDASLDNLGYKVLGLVNNQYRKRRWKRKRR